MNSIVWTFYQLRTNKNTLSTAKETLNEGNANIMTLATIQSILLGFSTLIYRLYLRQLNVSILSDSICFYPLSEETVKIGADGW